MSKVSKGKIKIAPKTLTTIVVVVGIAILAVGAGLLAHWLLNGGTAGSSGNQGGVIGLPSNPQTRAVVNAQNLSAQGKYDQAEQSITTALNNSTDSTEKYDLYLEQGANFENQQKYAEAIAAYNNANTIKPAAGTYDAIGRIAETIGNKQLAIDSYTKEISLLPRSSDRSSSLEQQLQAKIKELQG